MKTIAILAAATLLIAGTASAKEMLGCEIEQTAQGFYVKTDPNCQMTGDQAGAANPADEAGAGRQ